MLNAEAYLKAFYNETYVNDKVAHEREMSYNRQVGYEDGKNEGITKGIEQNSKEIARVMLENNYSVDEIIKITKLSKKEIETLEKKRKIK